MASVAALRRRSDARVRLESGCVVLKPSNAPQVPCTMGQRRDSVFGSQVDDRPTLDFVLRDPGSRRHARANRVNGMRGKLRSNEGYIGPQNHSDKDVVYCREVAIK